MAPTTVRRRRKGFWSFAAVVLAALFAAVFAGINDAAPATATNWHEPGIQSDPQVTGCDKDAVTAETFPLIDESTQRKTGIVEVRYSPHCGTNWVRVTAFIKGVVEKSIGTAKEPLNGIEADDGPGTSWSY